MYSFKLILVYLTILYCNLTLASVVLDCFE